MDRKKSVAIVENFWREVWKAPQNPDAIDRLVTEDFGITSGGLEVRSREAFKQWVIDFQSKITALDLEIIGVTVASIRRRFQGQASGKSERPGTKARLSHYPFAAAVPLRCRTFSPASAGLFLGTMMPLKLSRRRT